MLEKIWGILWLWNLCSRKSAQEKVLKALMSKKEASQVMPTWTKISFNLLQNEKSSTFSRGLINGELLNLPSAGFFIGNTIKINSFFTLYGSASSSKNAIM